MEKEKRSWQYEKDVLEKFDKWCEHTDVGKGTAAQLGIWIIMGLDPVSYRKALDKMRRRTGINAKIK